MSIKTNIMAAKVAESLNGHYGRLATSTERLSSGLRVNSAADDAAGLAIRELMRSDVAALNQGMRNANDAVSMLQVADSALAIIDEKLIRMKELAEQAATGTYDSTQRLMIDSEFQAMGAEIDRIANVTDFNGIHILDGSLKGQHDGSGLTSNGAMKIHFGTANDSAEDYYYVDIDDCTTAGLGLGNRLILTADAPPAVQWITEAKIDTVGRKIILDVPAAYAGRSSAAFMTGLDYYGLPVGLENITVTSNAISPHPFHKPHVCLFTRNGTQLTGPGMDYSYVNIPVAPGLVMSTSGSPWWNNISRRDFADKCVAQGLFDPGSGMLVTDRTMITPGNAPGMTITYVTGQNEYGSRWTADALRAGEATEEIIDIDVITSDLVFFIGGHDNPSGGCNHYRLRIEADITETFLQKLKVWSGQETLDEYYGDMVDIKTQEKAQKALARIDGAIGRKDEIRAHLGALQNRLENTVSNISIQSENLQAAESRISDADIAQEMTTFVRNQVLSQSAVAMLGQANSFPHMLMSLLNG